MGQGPEDGIEDLVEEFPVVAQASAALSPDIFRRFGAEKNRPVEGGVLDEAPLNLAELLVLGVLGVHEAHRHQRHIGPVAAADRERPPADPPSRLAPVLASADDDGACGREEGRCVEEELVVVLKRQVAPGQGGDCVADSFDGIHAQPPRWLDNRRILVLARHFTALSDGRRCGLNWCGRVRRRGVRGGERVPCRPSSGRRAGRGVARRSSIRSRYGPPRRWGIRGSAAIR